MRTAYGVLFSYATAALLPLAAADEPPAPALSPEVAALIATARGADTPPAGRAAAWKALAEHPGADATAGLAHLLRDEDAKVAQQASDALRPRDAAKVRAAVLAALGTVPPEKGIVLALPGTPAQRDAWRALGLSKIELHQTNANVRRGKVETVRTYDKAKKLTEVRVEFGTPVNLYKVVGYSDRDITQASQLQKLCTQAEKDLDVRMRKFGGAQPLLLYEAAGPRDQRLVRLGLALVGRDDDGRKEAAEWRKQYDERSVAAAKEAQRELLGK